MDYLEQKRTDKVLEGLTAFVNETDRGKRITRERFLEIAKELHTALDKMYWSGDFGDFK